jgi:uncharacterized protein (TIGR02452 family)
MSTVRFLPAIDSAVMADENRQKLDIGRTLATRLAEETVAWCQSGVYMTRDGKHVDIRQLLSQAVTAKRSIPPEADLPTRQRASYDEMTIQVANETTTAAARRLQGTCRHVLALNFANGVNPGGGFLFGARAQEETLCRMSALYPTLVNDPMYEYHRARPDKASSAWAILSHDVPILRDESGEQLERPWLLSFITCAAPVATDLPPDQARALLAERIHRVIAIAQAYRYDGLVLGAWGCGAFGNDPATTADDFRAALTGPFAGAFREVAFAITDWSGNRRFLRPFSKVLGDLSS